MNKSAEIESGENDQLERPDIEFDEMIGIIIETARASGRDVLKMTMKEWGDFLKVDQVFISGDTKNNLRFVNELEKGQHDVIALGIDEIKAEPFDEINQLPPPESVDVIVARGKDGCEEKGIFGKKTAVGRNRFEDAPSEVMMGEEVYEAIQRVLATVR